MNILFSIAGLDFGGSEVFMLRITKKLSETHRVILINTRPDFCNDQLIKTGLGDKVTLHQMPSIGFFNALPFLKKADARFSLSYKIDAFYLKAIMWYYAVQLVCSFKYESDAFICSALKNNTTPVVISTRGCYSLMQNMLASSKLDFDYFVKETKHIFSRANGLIWLTQKNIDVLKTLEAKVPATNIQIYNGFPLASINNNITRHSIGIAENAIVFGMVARGIKEKGWSIAIDAFLINKEHTDKKLVLILVGDGPYIQELKMKYAYEKTIIFVGKIDNPVNYIQLFDVALLPTWFAGESIPNSVVEYLYCGKPVIATDWVEIPEMLAIEGGIAGYIIPLTAQQMPDQTKLAAFMQTYIENDGLLKEHTLLAKSAFDKFSMDVCAEKYRSFFQTTIDESRSY